MHRWAFSKWPRQFERVVANDVAPSENSSEMAQRERAVPDVARPSSFPNTSTARVTERKAGGGPPLVAKVLRGSRQSSF